MTARGSDGSAGDTPDAFERFRHEDGLWPEFRRMYSRTELRGKAIIVIFIRPKYVISVCISFAFWRDNMHTSSLMQIFVGIFDHWPRYYAKIGREKRPDIGYSVEPSVLHNTSSP